MKMNKIGKKKNIIIAITVTCSLFVLGGVQILYAADNGASTTVDTISGTTKAQSEKSRSNSDTQSLQLTAANPVDFSSTDSTTQTNSMATDDANVDTATTNTVSQSSKSNDSLTLQPANTVSSGSIDLDPGHVFATPSANQQQAFQNVAEQSLPMTPDQIIYLKKRLQETQRAKAASATFPPKPTVSTQTVNLAPGATPPVVRLQQGFVTSVVFVDNTGADWPIDSYDLGNSKAFNIQVASGSNTMMIQAIDMYTYGNLAVNLKGLSTPVMLTLVPGGQAVDYRLDLRIQNAGPNATMSNTNQIASPVSDELLSVLDGVPPADSQILQVSDSQSQAWLLGDKMYLRTHLTVLSPSWDSVVTSPDGMKAYEMQKSPMVLVSKFGQPVQLTIEGL
ncbi:MAG: DotH/IcmK family type IV secretion protein [Pseudomonadota bacterium]